MNKEEFEKIMDLGIKREIEAYKFYNDVVNRVDDKALKDIFNDLAKQELGHRNLLEELKYNPEIPVKISKPSIDYGIAETVELPELSINMKPAEALALAMKKEQQAAEFYQELAESTSDMEIKKLCLEMAGMELSHKQKLENAYTDIAYIESF
ncbi:MAG: ferritin family protein [Candidatus Cloacimonadota bacterium]|nr:ferritin family protein [Candidatus Cloacimonadota bacterium]